MTPGSAEFREALLSSLERDPGLRALGPAAVLAEERVSRNTVIYRCRIGEKRVVAKAQTTKPAAVCVSEYRMLQDMARKFGNGGRVRGLQPVALFPDIGVLVTEEEKGTPLNALIETACQGSEVERDRAACAVAAAADALRLFHEAYGGKGAPGRAGERVRWYLDFSPKNVLVKWGSDVTTVRQVVLMDPPEEEKWGARTEDIGVFCFGLARIRFLPRFIGKPGVSRRLDWFKAWFIRSYYESLGRRLRDESLEHVKQAEYRRATQTLKWYMRPWRYASPLTETLRLCYLGPLTATYRLNGIRKSYSNVSGLLTTMPRRSDEEDWRS